MSKKYKGLMKWKEGKKMNKGWLNKKHELAVINAIKELEKKVYRGLDNKGGNNA